MGKLISEFKDFAMRGNVMDMAVGVIIGGAFGKIVSSLVEDVIMPVVGMATGGVDFTELSVKIGEASVAYGKFVQNVVDFLIVAFCIFMVVKGINKLSKKREEAPSAPPEPTADQKLLAEIRDLLKNK